MRLIDCYSPPTNTHWQGRADLPDSSCFFQNIRHFDLHNTPSSVLPHAFAFLGFQCDTGILRNHGRIGATDGPHAIRDALAKLPLQRQGIHCYDAGDIICLDNQLEQAQLALAEAVLRLLDQGFIPIVLGGGHELAWGHYQGIAKKFPHESLGILNFDAHFDMRPLLSHHQGSSGTPFLQIAQAHEAAKRHFDYNCIGIQPANNIPLLFSTAENYNVHTLLAGEMYLGDKKNHQAFAQRIIEENQIIYLSLCLDVFASPYAPGVSAPQALGLTPWQVIPLLRQLAASGKVVSYDIAELSPHYDQDHRTAKLAANLIFEIIHHHAF